METTGVRNGTDAVSTVTLKTTDGWTIVGDLYTPAQKPIGAVVLLHQRGGSGADWQPLCQALQKSGIVALAIDQRGAGRSTQGPGSTGSEAPWDTTEDVTAALTNRLSPYAGHIGLAGASYGADNALIYAADHPNDIQAVALYSPGLYGHGLDILKAAREWSKPIVIYHGRGDKIADDGPQQIMDACPAKDHQLILTDENKHGTDLLNSDKIDSTVNFFERTLK